MSNSYYEKVSGETKKIDVPFAIPESWSWARLSSLCNIKGGKRIPKGFSFSTTPTKHIYIRVTDMKCQSIDISDLKYISDEVFEQIKQYTINDSDVYVSIAGTIGKVGTIPHMLDGMSLTENAVKLCNIQIDKDWLVTVLSSDFGQMKMVDRIHQVAQPKLSIISLSNTLIPIPPIEEQRRIHQQIKKTVSKLSLIASALSDIKELGTKLKYEILNYFFGDNSRYKSYYTYNEEKLADIATLITKGSTPTTYGFEYLSEGINFIKVENVKDYCVQHETIKQFISEKAHEFQKRSQLEKNDLLISIAGTLGRICLIRNEDLPANTNQAFAIVRGYSQTLLPDYLKWFITWYVDSKSQQLGHGGGMNNLTLGEIKALKIKYPVSKDNQQQIIDKVNACLEIVSAIQGV